MAAATSSSSKNLPSCCSPISGRPTNAVSRNSEISNPMRRSSSGTPFAKPSIVSNQRSGFNPNTPNNSPSDHPRRHSTSKENFVVSLRDHEEKENSSKDHSWKQARIRSPAPSKGTKNFMSPTISAASKVNASPRKKILAERNEPIRSSVSFSDAKSPGMEDLESKPEKGMNQKKEAVSGTLMEDLESKSEEGLHKKREVSFDSTVTFIGEDENFYSKEEDTSNKEELDSSSECVTVGNDWVKLDTTFKISPKVIPYFPSPALAPLDADPSVPPPYDPKKNYLSPRPMFLHYRPNPRIGVYLNKERDGKQLEEAFISECLSEADASEEESLSEDSEKESEAASCDQSVVEDVEEKEKEREEEKKEEEELLVSGPGPSNKEEVLLVSEPNPSNMSEGIVEMKRRTKSPFITRTKLTALVLAVAMVFLYVSFANSPIMDPSVLNNLSFPELQVPPQIAELTRQNFEALAQQFQLWLAHSLSSARDIISSLRERHKMGPPLQYANLTIVLEDGLVDSSFVFDDNVLGAVINDGNSILGHVEEGDQVDDGEYEVVESDEGIGESVESYDDRDEFVDGDDQESEEQEIAPFDDNVEIPIEHGVPEAEECTAIAIIPDETSVIEVELQGIKVLEDEPVTISQIAEIHPEVSDSRQLLGTEELSSEFLVVEPEVSDSMKLLQSTEETDSSSDIKSFAFESSQESLVENKAASSVATPTLIFRTEEIEPEVPDSMQLQSTEDMDSSSDIKSFTVESPQESLAVDDKVPSSVVTSTQLDELQDVSSAQTMLLGISSLVLSLIAAVAFICVKNRTTATKTSNAPDNLALMTKKLGCTTTNNLISAEHNFQDGHHSRNWATEVDMVGDSCPSEMSSYQNSLCYSKKRLKGTTTRDYSSAQTMLLGISSLVLSLIAAVAFICVKNRMLLGISSLVLSLIAAVAFICVKNRTTATKTSNAPDNLALMTKKLGCTTTTNNLISAENNFQDGHHSRNWATEVDMVGDSCPSEMSSYQNSLCYSKKRLKGTTTRDSSAQSQETKPRKNNYRRESLASSDYSMGGGGGSAASYGSFTTYEKIHIKQGNADEEVITPVRRSSRIRKQVTSP